MHRGRPKGSKNKAKEQTQREKDFEVLESFVRANDGQYHVSMKLNGIVYGKEAATLIDAMNMFDWNFYKKTLTRPVMFPTVLTVDKQGVKAEITLFPYQLRRFFHSSIFRKLTEKNINKLWQ